MAGKPKILGFWDGREKVIILAFMRLYHDGNIERFWANRAKVDTIDEKPCYIDYDT